MDSQKKMPNGDEIKKTKITAVQEWVAPVAGWYDTGRTRYDHWFSIGAMFALCWQGLDRDSELLDPPIEPCSLCKQKLEKLK